MSIRLPLILFLTLLLSLGKPIASFANKTDSSENAETIAPHHGYKAAFVPMIKRHIIPVILAGCLWIASSCPAWASETPVGFFERTREAIVKVFQSPNKAPPDFLHSVEVFPEENGIRVVPVLTEANDPRKYVLQGTVKFRQGVANWESAGDNFLMELGLPGDNCVRKLLFSHVMPPNALPQELYVQKDANSPVESRITISDSDKLIYVRLNRSGEKTLRVLDDDQSIEISASDVASTIRFHEVKIPDEQQVFEGYFVLIGAKETPDTFADSLLVVAEMDGRVIFTTNTEAEPNLAAAKLENLERGNTDKNVLRSQKAIDIHQGLLALIIGSGVVGLITGVLVSGQDNLLPLDKIPFFGKIIEDGPLKKNIEDEIRRQ